MILHALVGSTIPHNLFYNLSICNYKINRVTEVEMDLHISRLLKSSLAFANEHEFPIYRKLHLAGLLYSSTIKHNVVGLLIISKSEN